MSKYRVIDNFQIKHLRVIALDRDPGMDAWTKDLYIDGVKYEFMLNSVRRWIVLPDVDADFMGKTVEFR